MKVLIIGSTQYQKQIADHKRQLEEGEHEVLIPAFDSTSLNELEVCLHNRQLIIEADEVHVIWDCRSFGTIFDFGMTFALQKPFKIIYLEPKTFMGVMKRYEELCKLGLAND